MSCSGPGSDGGRGGVRARVLVRAATGRIGVAPSARVHAAAIGVPVVVIVTVGAGALMMLTGKANDMLAVRADAAPRRPPPRDLGDSQAPARLPAGYRRPSSALPCPATRASAAPSPSRR